MRRLPAAYDKIAKEYAAFTIDHNNPATILGLATQQLLDTVDYFAESISNLNICDLGCGEGHLARKLAEKGARIVGIDLSEQLLEIAKQRTNSDNIRYIVDDAHELVTQAEKTFDIVVSNLALMDMSNLDGVYMAVRRVIKPSGYFIFSITHPCFQSPHTEILMDEKGGDIGRKVSIYEQEGYWESDNREGIRGKVGAYHRTMSTYLNLLIDNGFGITPIK